MYPYISVSCIFLLTYASANENFMEEYTTFDDKGRDLLVQSSGRLRRTIDLNDEFIVAVRYYRSSLFVLDGLYFACIEVSYIKFGCIFRVCTCIILTFRSKGFKNVWFTYTTYKNYYITCIDYILCNRLNMKRVYCKPNIFFDLQTLIR